MIYDLRFTIYERAAEKRGGAKDAEEAQREIPSRRSSVFSASQRLLVVSKEGGGA